MLRSIQKAYEEVKKEDPDTAVTPHTIRLWVNENKIKHLNAGTKILVELESLFAYIGITKS